MKEKYSCLGCGVRFGEKEALETGYRCPECGDDLQDKEEASEDSMSAENSKTTTTASATGFYVGIAICALVIFFILAKGGINLNRPADDTFESKAIEQQLEKARSLNKKTPMMVDKSTRLDQVEVEGRNIVFQSTLVNTEAEKKAGEGEFKEKVKLSLAKKYCANKETMKALKLGITYGHEYFSQDGKLLFSASVTLNDCPEIEN